MSVVQITQLPTIGNVTLDDFLVIEQLTGTLYITHKVRVRQLLGSFSPVPTITSLIVDREGDSLAVKGINLLPTTLFLVNDKPYQIMGFENGELANEATVYLEISLLTAGTHTVKVKNFINEASSIFAI